MNGGAIIVMMLDRLLHGPRVYLAPLTSRDLPTMAQWYQDSGFLRLFDADPAYPRAESELTEWLDKARRGGDSYAFGIRLIDRNELIGLIELDEISWSNGVCGLAIAIGERGYWRKGYGQEAARLALGFAFGELNLHRVQATILGYNERSIRMFERLGFRREGTFREFLHRDGQRHDMHLYGLLRPEWEARPPEAPDGQAH